MRFNRLVGWLVLGAVFLGINDWMIYRYASRDVKSVRVRFEAGHDGVVAPSGELSWTFSADMVGADKVGIWQSGRGPLIFEPAAEGRFCWLASNKLVFQPGDTWRECSRYSVRFEKGMVARDGLRLAPWTGLFGTSHLKLESIAPVRLDSYRHCTLRLLFNSAPAQGSLQDYLKIRDSKGHKLDWDQCGQLDSREVLVRTAPIYEPAFHVSLRQGLPAKSGSLGLEKSLAWKFDCNDGLLFTGVRAVSDGFGDSYLEVKFNKQVDLTRVAEFVEITPALKATVGSLVYSWDSGFCMRGKFKPGQQYTLHLKPGVPGVGGQLLGKEIRRQVYFPDYPAAVAFDSDGQYLSTQGSLLVGLRSVNAGHLKVTSERIYPNNFVQFAMREADRYSNYYSWGSLSSGEKLSHIVAEREYYPATVPNKVEEVRLDVRKLMGEFKSGAFLLSVKGDCSSDSRLVVVSDIGITVKRSPHDLLVWANHINSSAPLAGGAVRVYSEQNQELASARTDSNGVVRLEIDSSRQEPFLVTVQSGDDISYLRLDGTETVVGTKLAGPAYARSEYRGYLFGDRGIYRPGEMVHIKAVLRDKHFGVVDHGFPIEFRILRPDGQEFRKLTSVVSCWGTAACDLPLPKYAMTGRYRIELRIPGSKKVLCQTRIAVEEFVPPSIRVKLECDQPRIAGKFSCRADAQHLFGSPASGLPVASRIQLMAAEFVSDKWPGYHFSNSERKFAGLNRKVGNGKLDKEGRCIFNYEIPQRVQPPSALKMVAGVTVREVSGRAVTAYLTRMVDVYSHYVGIKRSHCGDVVKVGDALRVELAAVSPDGSVADVSTLKLKLQRIDWHSALRRNSNGSYSYQSERYLAPVSEDRVELKAGKGEYTFAVSSPGQYLLLAESPDKKSGSASISFYAGSPENRWLSWSRDKPGQVELALDKPDGYRVGEQAVLVVKSPFCGRALLTVESDRVVYSRVFAMTGNTTEVKIPVREEMLPNVYCTVNVIRPVKAEKVWRAHRAVGAVALAVRLPKRRLQVEIDAPQKIEPESMLTAKVHVCDCTGKVAAVELTVAAVDEGICMLTDFRLPDPLKYFLRRCGLGVQQFDLYSLLMPELDGLVQDGRSAPGGDAMAGLGRRLNPIDAARFHPVALWQESVVTDTNGDAKVSFAVPEFSGELRLSVVAVGQQGTGSASVPVKVKRKLVVLSGLPRFLAPSDSVVVPIRVFNETGRGVDAEVNLKCSGPLSIKSSGQFCEAIAAGESRCFEFELAAAAEVGRGRVEIEVTAGAEHYRESFELAVRPAVGRVVKSVSGSVKSGESVELDCAGDLLTSTLESRVVCSGQAAVRLNGSLDYLLHYPYGCLEQTVSASFPLLNLAALVDAMHPGSLKREDVADYVQAGIWRVLAMQQSNGSFSYWPSSRKTYRWGSVYAVNFLLEAKRAGYAVSDSALQSGLAYLRKVIAAPVRIHNSADREEWLEEMRVRSYICYVLALGGTPDHGWLARLQEQHGGDVAIQLNVAAALAESGLRREAGQLLQGIAVSRLQQGTRSIGGSLVSPIRNTAMMLHCWLAVDPENPAVTELVRQLNGMQVNGGWFTTQDNAVALLALGRYCQMRSQLNQSIKAEISVSGDRIKRYISEKDVVVLTQEDIPVGAKLKLDNAGPGVLYYSLVMSGVPADGKSQPAGDHGVAVRRELLTLDGSPLDSHSLEAGTVAVVRISVNTLGQRLRNLVVEDLLPAGLEVENVTLKTSQVVPWAKQRHKLGLRHVEVRDDRVLIFADTLSGSAEYYYVVRAVSCGDFIWPAISCECMYDAGINSRGKAVRLVVAGGGE